MATEAEQIYCNGTVHTCAGASATAIALASDRVLATGDDAAMRSLGAPGARVIDLRGKTVVPGLIDSHNHLLSTGLNAEHVDLSAANTIRDVLTALGGQATVADGWVMSSSRWHETQLAEARFPTRDELDRIAPSTPVLIRRGGHNVVANSTALRLAGIDEATVEPPGGTYVRDAAGRLTGHVIGRPAYTALTRLLPQPDDVGLEAAIRRASALYHAAGLTGVIEPGLGTAELRAYQRLHRQGELSMRTALMPSF
ncbi:MAG: amidohydrolase, partial [Dehalococcoidia bacterium]